MITGATILDRTFAEIERAAIHRKRCPKTIHSDVADGVLNGGAVAALVLQGRIRIEISGHNYRTATILTGPHAGKKTAPDPSGSPAWKISDASGTRINGKPVPAHSPRNRGRDPARPLIRYAGAPR